MQENGDEEVIDEESFWGVFEVESEEELNEDGDVELGTCAHKHAAEHLQATNCKDEASETVGSKRPMRN